MQHNHLFGNFFSSHNNLALKFNISDFLLFEYFLSFIQKNISRDSTRIPGILQSYKSTLSREIEFPVPGEILVASAIR